MFGGPIVLASTSEARARLCETLFPAGFTTVAPRCDEGAIHGRSPDETALLRAFAKAVSVGMPEAIVIGSDQLVDLDGRILGKPGTAERARAQLAELSGRTHRLVTAVVVVAGELRRSEVVVHRMTMRSLAADEIAQYVELDRPEGCAGSYRFESRGHALFASVDGDDPTAIEGLPVRALSAMLAPLAGAREARAGGVAG